ncbi:MAG TPA: hypothetical protein VM452_09795 [Caulifigura sp.]|nr:hypothetical protein [Caulifigura sp.]
MLLVAACVLVTSAVFAADEPSDPISRLGQRSALQRWKEARSEWIGGGMRRDRRQQNKQGGAIDHSFAPDVAHPAEPRTAALPEASGKVDLSPELPTADAEAPGFIAPPRSANPISAPVVPVPLPEVLPDLPPAGPSEIQVLVPDPPATPLAAPVTAVPRPFPLAEQEPRREDPTAKDAPVVVPPPDLAPGEPSAVTALLNQIPRPPVAPSPTPASPPTRLPPAPPPRLPEESPSFIIPRSDPLIPPEPAGERTPLAARAVSLPQLRKVT